REPSTPAPRLFRPFCLYLLPFRFRLPLTVSEWLPVREGYLSNVVPHFLHTRTLRSPRTSCPTRTGPQLGQTSCTFEIAIRLSCSAMPPLTLRCGFGRTCFFTIITCSTRIFASFGNTRSTRPSLPLSRPVITFTVSFRRRSTRLFAVLTVLIKSVSRSQSSKVSKRITHRPASESQGPLIP